MNPETLAQWTPFINYGVVVLTGAVLTLAGRVILDRWDAPSGLVLINYLMAVVFVGGYAVFRFTLDTKMDDTGLDSALATGGGAVMFKLCLGLMTLFPSYYYASQIAGGWYGGAVVDTAFWTNSVFTKPKSSYGKAFALAKHNDVLGAVRQFRAYFDEDPKEPSPLFYAAELLTHERFHSEAVTLYLRIMNLFEKKAAVWAGACYLLAEVYSLHMGRTEDAKKLLRSMIERTRQRHLRQMATDRIAALDPLDGTAAGAAAENRNRNDARLGGGSCEREECSAAYERDMDET